MRKERGEITYIFEDYRDDSASEQFIFHNKADAEGAKESFITQGNLVFCLSKEKVVHPAEKKGSRIITYGIFTDHHLPSLPS